MDRDAHATHKPHLKRRRCASPVCGQRTCEAGTLFPPRRGANSNIFVSGSRRGGCGIDCWSAPIHLRAVFQTQYRPSVSGSGCGALRLPPMSSRRVCARVCLPSLLSSLRATSHTSKKIGGSENFDDDGEGGKVSLVGFGFIMGMSGDAGEMLGSI
jgi:hypothetical protein